jgi:phospholipase/carboxylesterase
MRARLSPSWPDAASDDDTPLILLLHGYGSNEDDLPGLAPWLPEGIPWASVRGPIDLDWGGAAWFPLDLATVPEQEPIDAATEALWERVESLAPAASPLVPLGFSQGGCLALQLLRTRPERVAAAVVLSGFVTDKTQPGDDALAASRPPVFWGRGDEDPLIWPEAIEHLASWLPEHAAPTVRVYRGLGHGVSDHELEDVRAFLAEHV